MRGHMFLPLALLCGPTLCQGTWCCPCHCPAFVPPSQPGHHHLTCHTVTATGGIVVCSQWLLSPAFVGVRGLPKCETESASNAETASRPVGAQASALQSTSRVALKAEAGAGAPGQGNLITAHLDSSSCWKQKQASNCSNSSSRRDATGSTSEEGGEGPVLMSSLGRPARLELFPVPRDVDETRGLRRCGLAPRRVLL